MKMTAKKIFIALLMGFTAITAYSQTDSVKIEYSQEKLIKANKLDEAICDILTKREKRDKDIWKFNLLGTFFGGFNISYERKIARKWSLNAHSVTNFDGSVGKTFRTFSIFDQFFYNPYSSYRNNRFEQKLSFELRCYYSIDKRERLGKKTGFSGNYFGLSLMNTYNNAYYNDTYFGYGRQYNTFQNSLNLIYGIQRRIGRVGYIDASAGFGYGLESSRYQVNFYPDGTSGTSDTPIPKYSYSRFQFFVPLKLGIGIAF